MFKYGLMVCSLLCCLVAAPLWAAEALVGNYASENLDDLRIIFKSDQVFRINLAEEDGEDVFMLMSDGKRWLVGRDDDESAWEAFDFGVMADFIAAMEEPLPDLSAKAKITKAGTQTVSGIAGEVFKIQYPDGADFEDYTLVLTDNADVAALTKAMLVFFKDFDEDDLTIMTFIITRLNQENKKDYGLLVFDDDFEFKGLAREDYPDSYFALPEGVEILDFADLFGEE